MLSSNFETLNSVSTGPIIGFLTDWSGRYWKNKEGEKDVQETFIIYSGILGSMVLLCLSLFITNHVWFFLIMIPLVSGLVFTYLSMGVAMNFPVVCHGTLFGVMNICGSLFNMLQGPVITRVKAGEGLVMYQLVQTIMTACLVPCLIIVVFIG